MSYIIYKRNTLGKNPTKIATDSNNEPKVYNGTPTELGDHSDYYSLPFKTEEAVGNTFTETTGLNIIANNGAVTELYIQFDELYSYPTLLTINGTQYSNNGYILHVENLSIAANSEIVIRFLTVQQNNGIINMIGISKDVIAKIEHDKIISIECNDESDELLFTLPAGYANILVKESAVQNLKENDEVNIFFEKQLIQRYYIKELKCMKDNQYNLYCEDIIGIFNNIDGGTVTLAVSDIYNVDYENQALYNQILRKYCDGIMSEIYLYQMYRTWSGRTIRENIQQFAIGQNSLPKKNIEYSRDTIVILTNESGTDSTTTIISKYDIYNDLVLEETETIKSISIICDYDRNPETITTTYDSPNATIKYEIKQGKILLNGDETLGDCALEQYLESIGNSYSQSGKQLRFTARLNSANDIKKIRAGSIIKVQTLDYGTLEGFIKSITYSISNTATAKIVMSLKQSN